MTNIADNINRLINHEGITPSDLSRVVGIDRSVLHKILSGSTKNPSIDSIKSIIDRYSYEEVVLGTQRNLSSNHKIPIISWAETTRLPSQDVFKNSLKFVEIATCVNNSTFGLIVEVSLDSRFPSGTLLIVDQLRKPENMHFIIIKERLSNIASMKRLIYDGSIAYLKSIDVSLPSIRYEKEHFQIIGTVIQSVFDFI